MRYAYLIGLLFVYVHSFGQFSITLKYKKPHCGGKHYSDTTTYFLLANQKWILISPNNKIDTVFTNIQGKVKIPNKKGKYFLYQSWKYYKSSPSDFPVILYEKQCLQEHWNIPDFTIHVISNKKYKISPLYYTPYCPDKHPCLRKDTVIPKIPHH